MSNKTDKKGGEGFFLKFSRFIVDKKSLIFLLFALLLIFSLFSRSWVKVENSLENYLPDDSETRQGISVMDEQFTTYGTARILFANVTLSEATAINEQISEREGVQAAPCTHRWTVL